MHRSNPMDNQREVARPDSVILPQISVSPYQPRHSSMCSQRQLQLGQSEEERLRLNVEKLRTKSQGKLILAALGMGHQSRDSTTTTGVVGGSDWTSGTSPTSQLEPVDQRL